MKVIGSQRQVILLCDSWYPKAEVADLVNQFENLELICNVRNDTVLYGLPPASNGKRVRPRKRGDRIDLELCADETICTYGRENVLYLPLAWYRMR